MRSSQLPKNGYLIVVPWGLHHIGGVNQAVLNLRSQISRNSRLRPVVLITESDHNKTEIVATNTEFREYRLTLRQPIVEAHLARSLISYIIRLPWTLFRLHRVLHKENISTINVHYPSLSSLTLLLVAKIISRNTKVVLSFHGSDVGNVENARSWHKWLWNVLLLRVDHIVTCSSALALRLSNVMQESRNPIKTVHNGVDQDLLGQRAEKGRIPETLVGKRFILNVATLEWKKGQDFLIKAFSLLASHFPEHLLVIMGRHGESEKQLRLLMNELNLNDRVLIYENASHEDVLATMKKAELFVLPSRIEPFGIVLLEAATFGVPVIATRTGGIPEIIEHDESGVLIMPEDEKGLSSAMYELLNDRKRASTLADQLCKRVSSKFTLVHVAQEYESMAGVTDMS